MIIRPFLNYLHHFMKYVSLSNMHMDNVPTILNHRLQQRESKELDLWVLVCNSFFERFHHIFCFPRVAVEDVADLQVHRPVRADEHVARRPLHQHRRHRRSAPPEHQPAKRRLTEAGAAGQRTQVTKNS
uniref:Uncharacterized protein n=1 Tax=Arundo donax TaxID=35708 RepID=A0A0A9C2L6_ARUDO